MFFQFAIVTLMYVNVGKGKILANIIYAALAGCIGSIIENGTVAYLCRKSEVENNIPRFKVITFFIAEFCWIVEEFSVPLLNLTKMKAFSKGKATKIVNYIIFGLLALFIIFRFGIGYHRMSSGLLSNNKIKAFHSLAFGVMAVADLICTFGILYFVKKHNQQENINTSNINHYIKRSSYIILVCVDVVGVCLSLFNFLIEHFGIPGEYLTPFHCVKCSFTLILACDALLFKYSVNTSSVHDSSNYRYADSYNYNSSFKNYNNKSRSNYNIDISNKSQNNPLSNYGKSDSNNFQTKNSENTYQTQQFGFLYS
ncbi:hypothetical protein LY90DRAFT_708961 [Neocallimastix californiae]|uniref:Integral membrane protein n=1 Tax=Neocallimastix californiae TaxID=1754190 RepID=A0A1Y1ZHX7_9FUNG|nr:hypothetical protein LY90DRAFT_708961 [Neocallimastix californiae]|eukprot:ORY09799.1 hypothetical protein LY90DRAFT_708961 [Neocallimastix californiae]